MNRIYYFSGSGKSKHLAEYISENLDIPAYDITKEMSENELISETAVIVFPVYCQNLPDPVIDFLPKINAKNIAFAVTYGRKSYGNVMEDALKFINAEFIGGVCVPCGHSFLDEEDGFDFVALSPFIERINDPKPASVEKRKKSFYADLVPAKRTQLGVKINRSDKCNNCGKCISECPMKAMTDEGPNKNCIRCLRCVKNCPEGALSFKTLWFMKIYLKNWLKNEYKFYL